MRPEKTFNVPVSNGLLDPRHYKAIGDAVWLFICLIDKQTRGVDKNGHGEVSGGSPIRDSVIASALGCSRRTVIRWRGTLAHGGYITARRTPYGYVYCIKKPKKWRSNIAKTDVTPTAHLSEGNNSTDVQVAAERCAGTCTNKEEVTRDYKSSSSAAADSQIQMEKELKAVWNYYLDAFDKEETLSPSLKRIGLAILSKLNPDPDASRVAGMAAVIDMAHYIVKHDPSKAYFAEWPKIFGKFTTFKSLYEQWRVSEVPDAAELPKEFLPAPTSTT